MSDKHNLITGLEAILYNFNPGLREPMGADSNVERLELEKEKSLEAGLFIEDEYTIRENLSIRVGLRYSSFTNLGDGSDYIYGENDSRTASNITDTVYYSNNETIAQYQGFEPRATINYELSKTSSLKIKMYYWKVRL